MKPFCFGEEEKRQIKTPLLNIIETKSACLKYLESLIDLDNELCLVIYC